MNPNAIQQIEYFRAVSPCTQPIADATHHIPVLPHYYKEYDVPLLMTVANAFGAESFDWVDDLITYPIHIENGFAYPNPGPGWGFEFKPERLTPIG